MNKTNENSSFKVVKSKESIEFVSYSSLSGYEYVLDFVKEKIYKASDLKVSRRVLSHWRSLGLIDLYGNDPTPTRLSLIELFWLQTTIELRSFGLSLDSINAIKDHFFRPSTPPILESYLMRSMCYDEIDFFLVVSSDGRVDVGTREEVETSELLGFLEENYIKINFNIVKNKFASRKVDIINQKSFNKIMSNKEVSLIDLIRNGDYKEITLKLKNGVVSHISKKVFEQNPDPIKEIRDIVQKGGDFCKISITRVNGKFVSMETDVVEKT